MLHVLRYGEWQRRPYNTPTRSTLHATAFVLGDQTSTVISVRFCVWFFFLIKRPVNHEGRIRTFFLFLFCGGWGENAPERVWGENAPKRVLLFLLFRGTMHQRVWCVCVCVCLGGCTKNSFGGESTKESLGENPPKRVWRENAPKRREFWGRMYQSEFGVGWGENAPKSFGGECTKESLGENAPKRVGGGGGGCQG